MTERKSVYIAAPTAPAKVGTPQTPNRKPSQEQIARNVFDRRNIPLFDPDQPEQDLDELMKQLGGMRDPNLVNHNCPFCKRTMRWELFVPHMTPCVVKWGSLHKRNFPGATLEPDRIEEPAGVTSG